MVVQCIRNHTAIDVNSSNREDIPNGNFQNDIFHRNERVKLTPVDCLYSRGDVRYFHENEFHRSFRTLRWPTNF